MPLMPIVLRQIREQARTVLIAESTAQGVPFFEAVSRAMTVRTETN